MNKIIYFTTAQETTDFANQLKNFTVAPNLSNQNFHNKMIRCLSLSHDIDVISVRPINKFYKYDLLDASIKKTNNINWHYIKVTKSRLDRLFNLSKRINSESLQADNATVFVDVLNFSLLKAAIKFAKSKKIKIIGVCTDNPSNISNVPKTYKIKILNTAKKLDGYVCLTDSLNELFNINKKPSCVFEGLSENISYCSPLFGDNYIYFGGSLMKEYGVYSLVDAFISLKLSNVKLVISGHHEQQDFIEYIKNYPEINYVKFTDYISNATLQHYALCCINPRPANEAIDNFSFPSKVLEYMSNGSITISTPNPLLFKYYADNIIWSKSSKSEDLANAIKKALTLSDVQRNNFISNSKNEVFKRTSLEHINLLLNKSLF